MCAKLAWKSIGLQKASRRHWEFVYGQKFRSNNASLLTGAKALLGTTAGVELSVSVVSVMVAPGDSSHPSLVGQNVAFFYCTIAVTHVSVHISGVSRRRLL